MSKGDVVMGVLAPFNKWNKSVGFPEFELFNNMIDDFFSDWPIRRRFDCDTFKVDVREEDDSYVIEAELPGVKKNEISLSFDDNRLVIAVTRDEKTEKEKKNYLHRERRICSMQRSIYLAEADGKGIKAKLDNGELTITVAKKQTVDKSIKIDID
jgi:HSP20 family protein